MALLNDGFATLFAFSGAPSIKLKEKTVTPPGVSGGGPKDMTHMRNVAYRTQLPKLLKTIMAAGIQAYMESGLWTDLIAQTNVNQAMTITFPDSHTLVFWGWLDECPEPEMKEGEPPLVTLKIEVSNLNGSGVETGPVYA